MGNSLLDFVMALMRDPAAGARYAADPAGALADAQLADAQLAGVTVTDVDNLIPVVADSLAASTPGFGDATHAANVWATGAAAAAFDAFDIHVPGYGMAPDAAPPAITVPAVDVSAVDVSAVDGPAENTVAVPLPTIGQTPELFPPLEPTAPAFTDSAACHPPAVDPHVEHHPGDAGFDHF